MAGQFRLLSLGAEAPEERESVAVGALVALALALLFVYPSRAYPLQSLFACGLLAVAALLLLLFAFLRERAALLRALGSGGMLALAALAVWGYWRWKTFGLADPERPGVKVNIPGYGYSLVVSLGLAAVSAALGAGLACLGRRGAPLGWGGFRRLMVLAAVVFASHGIWQFVYGYEAAYEEFRRMYSERQVEDDLMRESLLYMLDQKRIGGHLGNPNVFAALLSILAAFSLSMWNGRTTGVERGLGTAAYALCLAAMLLTQSRGGLLTFIAATVGAIAILRLTRDAAPADSAEAGSGAGRAGGKKQGAAPAALILAAALYPVGAAAARAASEGLFARFSKMNTVRERFYYWEIAREVWAGDWLFGAGPGSFQILYPSLKPPAALESRYAHSWVMHLGAELGAVGVGLFAIFLAAVALAAARLWNARRSAEGSLPLAREGAWLALACGLLAFNGLFEYSLQLREFLVMTGLLGGGVIGLAAREAAAAGPPAPARALAAVAAAAALAAGLALCAPLGAREQVAAFYEIEAKALADASSHAEASEFFQKAARWMPENESYLSGQAMAFALDLRANVDPALEMLARAQAMNPLSARIRQQQAHLYAEQQRLALAAKKMDEAVKLYPFDAGHRMDRAEIYLNRKLPAEAKLDLDFIGENDLPVRPPLRPKLERLKKRAEISGDHLPEAAPGGPGAQ